jgi:UTP--glucose-1-phosphate uridylyltransferase
MIKFVYQNKPLGTGDAVLKTKKYIKNNFFLMLLPDDLIINKNCSKSMIKIHKKYNSSVMASMNVSKKTVSRWGIYNLDKKVDKRNYLIKEVVEKPSVKSAPSNKAVIGRYILPQTIFSKLLKQKPGKGGEIHITDAIQLLINEKNKFIAHNFLGKYLDCGSMSGYIKSTLEIAKS